MLCVVKEADTDLRRMRRVNTRGSTFRPASMSDGPTEMSSLGMFNTPFLHLLRVMAFTVLHGGVIHCFCLIFKYMVKYVTYVESDR